MKIEACIDGSYQTIAPQSNAAPPVIHVTRAEVDDRTGLSGGPTLAIVKIEDDRGLYGRFHISVTIKNGRPEVMVTAIKNNTETKVKAVADWML